MKHYDLGVWACKVAHRTRLNVNTKMWTERYTYVKVSTSIVLIRYYINQEIVTLQITMSSRIQSLKTGLKRFELLLLSNHIEFTFPFDFLILRGKTPTHLPLASENWSVHIFAELTRQTCFVKTKLELENSLWYDPQRVLWKDSYRQNRLKQWLSQD